MTNGPWDGVTPLCFVGMSGAGKSYWARRLHEQRGFEWHDCDLAIASHLGQLVTPSPGEAPVHAVGRWMGMPWTEGYGDREQRYLELEEAVTTAALSATRNQDAPQVLDTTGSVVYLASKLLEQIRSETLVVYLKTPVEAYDRMLERYLDEPKPVVWGGTFRPAAAEPPEKSLAACYRALLVDRDSRYRALCHLTLDADELERKSPTIAGFVDALSPT